VSEIGGDVGLEIEPIQNQVSLQGEDLLDVAVTAWCAYRSV